MVAVDSLRLEKTVDRRRLLATDSWLEEQIPERMPR